MTILVKDDAGLGNALLMDGYLDHQVSAVYEAIRQQMRSVAKRIFSDILGKEPPETIVVNLAQNVPDRYDGTKSVVLASFSPVQSREDMLVFNVHENSIKLFLDDPGAAADDFHEIIVHEMIHAVDRAELVRDMKLLRDVSDRIQAYRYDHFSAYQEYPHVALFQILSLFEHYRAEGIAILGEHLVSDSAFSHTFDAIRLFRRAYDVAMIDSYHWAQGVKSEDRDARRMIHRLAYGSAPVILLKVLSGMGRIEGEMYVKALSCLMFGGQSLSDGDLRVVLESALGLGLHAYIQGLMTLGDGVAPMEPMLKICGLLKDDLSPDYVDHFLEMLRDSESEETFRSAMEAILGCVIPEDEIDAFHADFLQKPLDADFPDMKEKVVRLYDMMKESSDPDARCLAQWALTYLYDDQDVIHDDVPGLGLVDDMTVIDFALRLIGQSK